MTNKKDLLEYRLVSSIFKHAHKQLTNWPAWRRLLLGDSLKNLDHFQEIACRFVYAVVCHSTGNPSTTKTSNPPRPPIVDKVIM